VERGAILFPQFIIGLPHGGVYPPCRDKWGMHS
jgi:hypothetical protein